MRGGSGRRRARELAVATGDPVEAADLLWDLIGIERRNAGPPAARLAMVDGCSPSSDHCR